MLREQQKLFLPFAQASMKTFVIKKIGSFFSKKGFGENDIAYNFCQDNKPAKTKREMGNPGHCF